MSRLFTTTARPSSLQPVRPIIPAWVKINAAGLSSGSMWSTAWVPSWMLGISIVCAKSVVPPSGAKPATVHPGAVPDL